MSTATLLEGLATFAQAHWILTALAGILLYSLSNWFHGGLHKIPGPWTRKFTVIPRMLSVYNNHSQEDDILIHKKYGKIVRLGPNLLSITDTSEINTIYGIGTKFYKSGFYQLSSAYDEEGLVPDTFVLTDRQLHTRMKKNAANAYSLNGLVQMEPCIEPVTERLIEKLEVKASAQEIVDMAVVFKDYTMDAIFALTFGKDFNYLEKGDTLGMYGVIDTFSDYMAIVSFFFLIQSSERDLHGADSPRVMSIGLI